MVETGDVQYLKPDDTRANIYEKFSKWIGEKAGYDVHVADGRTGRSFSLVRKHDPQIAVIAQKLRDHYGAEAVTKLRETYGKLKQQAAEDPNAPKQLQTGEARLTVKPC